MPRSSPRERLIETARDLFSQYGYHATGIDRVLREAGVAKKTLYNHFHSKEELILAVLRRYDEDFRNWLVSEVEVRADNPRERMLAVFDVAEAWFADTKFYGCMFISAAGEYPDDDSAIRGICREFKRLVRRYFQQLAADAGAPEPQKLARQLALLLEGATVTAQVSADSGAARDAKDIARVLLDNALPRS